MRGRFFLAGAGLLLGLAGCGEGPATVSVPEPTVSVTVLPAAAAGGACELLDYPMIEETIGTRFDVSAAREYKKTQTCVVQAATASRPDLSLSVTKTSADKSVFANEMVPEGAKTVNGLGKAAYRLTLGPGKGHGAGVEVGWLSDGEVICLRYTFAEGHDKAAAEEFAPKLVALAEQIEAGLRS